MTDPTPEEPLPTHKVEGGGGGPVKISRLGEFTTIYVLGSGSAVRRVI